MANIGFISLGCAKNQVDCERMMYRVQEAGHSIKKCRILAVNRELDIIVLSAGTNSGIAPGMVFYADNDSGIRLRVIGVRVEGAAAELLSGEWKDVIPGMSVSALKVEKSESKGK